MIFAATLKVVHVVMRILRCSRRVWSRIEFVYLGSFDLNIDVHVHMSRHVHADIMD